MPGPNLIAFFNDLLGRLAAIVQQGISKAVYRGGAFEIPEDAGLEVGKRYVFSFDQVELTPDRMEAIKASVKRSYHHYGRSLRILSVRNGVSPSGAKETAVTVEVV